MHVGSSGATAQVRTASSGQRSRLLRPLEILSVRYGACGRGGSGGEDQPSTFPQPENGTLRVKQSF